MGAAGTITKSADADGDDAPHDQLVEDIVQCGHVTVKPLRICAAGISVNISRRVYFERRKVNSMAPSFQLRPPSLDESSRKTQLSASGTT